MRAAARLASQSPSDPSTYLAFPAHGCRGSLALAVRYGISHGLSAVRKSTLASSISLWLTHAHWALHFECRGAPVVRRGDARVAPPCPTTSCVWRSLPYLTLPAHTRTAHATAARAPRARRGERRPALQRSDPTSVRAAAQPQGRDPTGSNFQEASSVKQLCRRLSTLRRPALQYPILRASQKQGVS